MKQRADEFDRLARLERPHLIRRAMRLVENDPERAEDLVQDALRKAWLRFETFTPGTNFGAWSHTILYHLHVSRWRSKQGREDLAPLYMDTLDPTEDGGTRGVAPAAETPQAQLDAALLGPEVAAAVNALADEYVGSVLMFDLFDCTYSDIARALAIPLGTVRSRLYRGRRRLRKALAQWAADEMGIVA